jgi:hypothetical protein
MQDEPVRHWHNFVVNGFIKCRFWDVESLCPDSYRDEKNKMVAE